MESNANSVHLNVYIDKKEKKVIFAEAEEDFVEILFSFLMLPVGTIVKNSNKHTDTNNIKFGSLNSLYQSVIDLDILRKSYKEILVIPKSSYATLYNRLKVNLNDPDAASDTSAVRCASEKLVTKGSFIITDDLKITPFLLDKYMEFVNSNQDVDLVKSSLSFGFQELSNLLKWSILTDSPLTNLVFGVSSMKPYSSCITNATLGLGGGGTSNNNTNKTIKIMVHKSKKKVLCAQVDNFFVELLFSFLTIPLGTVKHLTIDNSSSFGIDNVYRSVSSLRDGNYLTSDSVKTMLLCPKLDSRYYGRATDLLPIYEKGTYSSWFLDEKATFVVSDDLEVAVSPSISSITKFTIGIPAADLEVLEVGIGEKEALLILKASLTSNTVLSDCLDAFRKNTTEK